MVKSQLQSEAAECGLACLAMLSSAHGLRIDLAELRQRFSISLKGANLAQLIRHAEALGFATRPLRLELDEMNQLQLPCMLHWDLNHFVVLTKVSTSGGGKITILDPAVGKRVLPMNEVSKHFTGVALELTPTPEFKPADLRRKVRLRDLVGKIFGLKRALINILLLAVGLEAVALVSPLVTQWVVDGALVSGDRDLLLLTVLGGGLLMIVQFLLSMARGWISLRMNQQLSIQFTANLFAHLLRLPLAFFEKRHVGDITSRFGSLAAIRGVLTQSSVSAALDGVMAIVTLAMMLLYSPKLSVVVLVALGLYLLLRWASFAAFRAANEERIVLSAREQSYFLETIRAVQPLKLFNRTPERLARWQNLMVDVQNRDLTTQKMDLWFSSANTLIFGVEGMLILYLGGTAVLERSMTLGMLLAFMAYKGQFAGRASSLINLVMQVKMLGLHAERLADIALEAPEDDRTRETDTSRLLPKVEVRNVSFRYAEGEPWVLRDCTLTIEPGEHVAICGPSGCGKSTLLKLMLGLLKPDEGDIRIGGVSLKQLGPSQYRALIGTVMQNDALMAGSLAENIACFDPVLDQARVEAVAALAQIHEEIVAMPMGYQTLVGDMGSTLSGGQRQRILLARALYKQPMILALDEATSSLDADNERHVNQAVKTLPLTRITIAHRQETINAAQRVIVLGRGQVEREMRAA
ncbi:peptidase domain-containing ABC transporter [Casimicrobium huifangae]|uniref:peptidase domain-containing ABC transporter n=1 Tax=Casimicrobium huifangae TaxID=2591109 RepID=UPI0012EC6F21|nr:peptidase domain-containing ABC transporter [Casimicrobium huifangae]